MINDILPTKAREAVNRLIVESQDAQFQLEFVPSSTVEYIQNLTFLDQIQERVSCATIILFTLVHNYYPRSLLFYNDVIVILCTLVHDYYPRFLLFYNDISFPRLRIA